MKNLGLTSVTSAALLALSACATSRPPQQLVDARRAYTDAEQSDASRYDPTDLHEARVALDHANNMYSDDGASPQVNDAAYVAQRRAEQAKVEGETAALQHRQAQLREQASQSHAKAMEQAKEQLTTAREQLDQVEQARKAAEAQADQAMMNLKLSRAVSKLDQQPKSTIVTIPGALLFASGKATLQSTANEKLDKVADALKQQGDRRIEIVGYTDSTGSAERNQELSKQRAEAVASYLSSHGVARDKLTIDGRGSSDPVASNDTPEGRADNRRVEITVHRSEPH